MQHRSIINAVIPPCVCPIFLTGLRFISRCDEAKEQDRQRDDQRRRDNGGIYNAVLPTPASAFSLRRFTRIGCLPSPPLTTPFTHHKRLVSWNCARCGYNSGWVRDPVKRRVMISNQDRSVSSIRALPLVINKTRTVTGATKPAQPKGGAGLASSHLQAGVI